MQAADTLRRFGMALVVLGTATAFGAEIEPQPIEGRIKWVYSYAVGKELARATGKPLFVVFRCER